MKFLGKFKNRKLVLFAVLAAVLIVGLAPREADADGFFEWMSAKAVGGIVSTLLSIIGWIGAGLFIIVGGLVNFSFDLNEKILISEVVKAGWPIALQFTNLGFVLAIIIIAFATILRIENYAMKQILRNLIIAALLVNFSLVIMGAFINVSDLVAKIFKNAGRLTSTEASMSLAKSFNPQRLMNISQITEKECIVNDKGERVCKDVVKEEINNENFRGATGFGKALLASIAGLAFAIIATFLMTLTLLALAIMMMIRYVVLVILAVLSPLALLCWVLPSTQHLWKQWWDNFLRWTFFAPAMMFFLYLAVLTSKALDVGEKIISKEARDAIESATLNPGLMDSIGNMVAMIGLILGGLYVANSLSITGASTAMGLAKGAGKGTGAWAVRKGLQWGTALPRARLWKDEEGKRNKSFGDKTVEWASKTGWIGRHTLGYAARGINRLETAGGENILKHHAKAATNMSDTDLKASVLTASGPREIAITKELQKRKLLGGVDAKNIITEGNQSLFGRFRQGASWENVEHGAKMNIKMAKQLRDTGETSEESVKEFITTYKGKDIEASAIKDLYSGKAKLGLSQDNINKLGAQFAKAFAMENYQMVPKLIPTMSAKERANFSQHYEDQILTLPNEWFDKNQRRVTLQKVSDAWDRTMSNYAMGFSAEAPTAGTTPPPPGP